MDQLPLEKTQSADINGQIVSLGEMPADDFVDVRLDVNAPLEASPDAPPLARSKSFAIGTGPNAQRLR